MWKNGWETHCRRYRWHALTGRAILRVAVSSLCPSQTITAGLPATLWAALLLVNLIAFGPAAIAQVPVPLPPVTPPAAPVVPAAAVPAALALPEPIYWKQQLFLIPYQWGAAAQTQAARSVSLFLSKDRGVSWQKISDARPDVRSFNYRAEGDGEYWFAVRTLDQYNRWLPEGPYKAELRVIVDTTIPKIDELRASAAADGAIDVVCRATDVNLNPASLAVESQTDPSAPWQPVGLQFVSGAQVGYIQARFLPAAARPATIRARISDRAGNTTVYQATPGAPSMPAPGPTTPLPTATNSTANPFERAGATAIPAAAPANPPTQPTLGWYTGAAAATQPSPPPAPQQWPANMMTRAPFQLWTGGASQQDDGLTAFGTPQLQSLPSAGTVAAAPANLPSAPGDSRVPAHYASASRTDATSASAGWTSGPPGPQFAPLEPFRESQATGANAVTINAAPSPYPNTASGGNPAVTPIGGPPLMHQPTTPPKLVGSRTFALEYDLDGSPSGVARVELWGTRDGGQSWNRFALDNDNRSPLVATVDDEGLYGFKILVQNVGGRAVEAPRAGEVPELWVAVDLKRPIIELTSIDRGEGNLADHLVLHWRAQDNNLEARPISLYFSSRPGGPWSAIATNLEDTGQYTWRVERYVPSKIYLRIEARDTAGNLAAFQTREPVENSPTSVTGRLRDSVPPNANR